MIPQGESSVTVYDQAQVRQCNDSLIFNEEKQACAEANSKEEIECLLIASLMNQETLQELINEMSKQTDETTSTTTTTTTSTTTTTTTSKVTTKASALKPRATSKRSLTLKEAKSRLNKILKKNSQTDETDEEDEKFFLEMLKSLTDSNESDHEEDNDQPETTTKAVTGRKSKLDRLKNMKRKKSMIRKQHVTPKTPDPNKLAINSAVANSKYKGMCIVTNWSQFRPGRGRFTFDLINVDLCNYIIFSSIVVIEAEEVEYEDEEEEFILKPVQHNDFGK
jgi:hypothetical protein